MAAALFRRGSGLCCMHRELCRVVWRPQAAEFCSRPTDRKPLHFKKAKAQPAVDVAELLQRFFPRSGPGPAPPVVLPAGASSVKASSSKLPPLSFSRGASAFQRVDARGLYNVTSGSSLTSAAPSAPLASLASERQTVEPATQLPVAEQVVEKTSSCPAASGEPSISTTDVEHVLLEPAAEAPAEQVSAGVSHGSKVITVDAAAQSVEPKGPDSGAVILSHAAEEEPSVETAVDPEGEADASRVSESPAGESAPSALTGEPWEGSAVAAASPEAVTREDVEAGVGGHESEVLWETESESAEHPGGALEAASLESVTLGTRENESLSETAHYLEREAVNVSGEKTVDVAEETTEALSQAEAADLSKHLQMDALMEAVLFSVPAPVTAVTGGPVGREAARADTLDATVASGSVDVDTAAVTDDPPALQEVVLQQEQEEEEEEEEAEASGNEDGKGTNADLDPVQRLFLEKIKEYQNIHRLNVGQLEAEPDYEKHLSEETAKLQRLYGGGGGGGGGGDLSSFPEFTFTEPQLDQDSK